MPPPGTPTIQDTYRSQNPEPIHSVIHHLSALRRLNVLILPPSPVPVHPRQRYPNSTHVDEDEELPEIEIGVVLVDLALKSDFRSRAGWESYKKRLREEEVDRGRKMLEEEEEEDG